MFEQRVDNRVDSGWLQTLVLTRLCMTTAGKRICCLTAQNLTAATHGGVLRWEPPRGVRALPSDTRFGPDLCRPSDALMSRSARAGPTR